jgi:peptide deformylase
MAVLDIVKYGDPRLVATNSPVVEFDDRLSALVSDMIETMYAAPGVGLAAPQIGVNRRLSVIDVSGGKTASDLLVLVNPVIVEERGEIKDEEGCLSFPGLVEWVVRPEKVVVKAFDVAGRSIEVPGDGLLARALCHEIDHLDSVLFTERMGRLKREFTLRKARKLAASGW